MSANINVKNVDTEITGIPPFIKEKLYDEIAFTRKGDEYSDKVATGEWDGVRRLFSKWTGKFPTGLWSMAKRVLQKHDVSYEITDSRAKPDRNRSWSTDLPWELRYYQEDAVEECLRVGRGICSLPTASGKTVVFSVLMARLSIAPVVVYVPSLLLLTQTADAIREFVRDSNGEPVEVGIVGDGKCEIKDITVMTVQTAITAYNMKFDRNKGTVRRLSKKEVAQQRKKGYTSKRKNREDPDRTENMSFLEQKKLDIKELIENARVVICDEAHRSASFIYQEIMKRSKLAYYRFAFSATPYREDGTGILIKASFGRILYHKTHSELVAEGFLARPYIFITHVPKSCVPRRGQADTYQQIVKNHIVESDARNRIIASITEQVCDIGPTMLLVIQKKHGRALEELIPNSVFIHGSTPDSKKEQAIEDMLSNEISALIATPIGDEGLDLVELEVLILCHATKSKGRLHQRIGRTSRTCPGKERSIIIDIRDSSEYLAQHGREREHAYLSEEEWAICRVESDGWDAIGN